MSKRKSIANKERSTPLRRSPRFSHHHNSTPEPQNPNTQKSKFRKNHARSPNASPLSSRKSDSPPKTKKKHCNAKSPNEPCRSSGRLRRSPRFSNGVEVEPIQSLRRSPRLCSKQNAEEIVKEIADNESKGKNEVGVDSFWEIGGKRLSIVLGLKAGGAGRGERKERESGEVREEIRVKRKREEEVKESGKIQGWTTEQEVALQRAYFLAKPTPHFWKRVSKLVPGKSAQDCFDKIHSDLATPPQPPPRSRANKINLSPMEKVSVSATKLLKPADPQKKRSSFNKQKSRLAQKTVRHLLEKNYHVDKDYEADLFSVLEPHINSSTQVCEQNGLLSTPKHLWGNQEFLQTCRERSSGHKKPLSRVSGSCGTALISPPVLKQVKNRALHEKYIDQLHSREAKRKAASERAERFINGKENKREIHRQNIDIVRAAKNALVTGARNAINQLQHLHANTTSNSDFDGDCDDSEDDEGESEL